MENSRGLIFAGIYLIVMLGLFFGCFFWAVKKRLGKHPLGLDIRLQRQAGEHLRKEWEEMIESFFARMPLFLMAPWAAMFVASKLLRHFSKAAPEAVLVGILACAVAAFIVALRWMLKLTDRILNLRLGWFGERVVADQLETIKSKGYEVFHDVPCIGGSGPFNLDHVVVGQGIVVVVETKTRRKPKNVKDNHKVSYNGDKLCWPWGQSTQELEQVLRNSAWLKKELKTHLNLDVKVRPALTIPGWFVTGGPPQAPVLVVGYKLLPQFILQRFPRELTDAQTELVARHLRKLSSDLDYGAL
ncbi:nuclease-like protein [Prosthecobacter fusiformis]|uniref:Nuclease-like protein n=1 Tax=Prosthecobacter fusiformis TaxID=48464 RepID=A0A4R7RY42_9BACT|nr:nuclease-related domain-containing protein [Prosthecobacter fusiformis]TDU70854.1 nuclease-like protein [Prosthecobacter fusiformis]